MMTKHRMQIRRARQQGKAEQLKYSKYVKEVIRIDKVLNSYGKTRTFRYSEKDFEFYKPHSSVDNFPIDKLATTLAGKGAFKASYNQANRMRKYMLSVGIKSEDIKSIEYFMVNGKDAYIEELDRLSEDSSYSDLDWDNILSLEPMFRDWSAKS